MYVYMNKPCICLFTSLHCIVKCSCHEKMQKNSINYMCVGPSIPVCSCIENNCQVNCIDL